MRTVVTSQPPASAAAEGSSRAPRDVLRLVRAARAERLDALLFPSLHTWFPSPRTPACVGVHDTIPDDLPDLSVDLVEDYPCRTNPMGIKGAGEAQLGSWLSINWFVYTHMDFRIDLLTRQESPVTILGQFHFYF